MGGIGGAYFVGGDAYEGAVEGVEVALGGFDVAEVEVVH